MIVLEQDTLIAADVEVKPPAARLQRRNLLHLARLARVRRLVLPLRFEPLGKDVVTQP